MCGRSCRGSRRSGSAASPRPSDGGPTAAAAAWHGEPRRRPPPAPPQRPDAAPCELVELSGIAGIGRLPQKSQLTGSERRALSGLAPPASTVLRIPLRGTRLRRAVDPGASASPAGLTARARPKARPGRRAATYCQNSLDHLNACTALQFALPFAFQLATDLRFFLAARSSKPPSRWRHQRLRP